MELDEYVDRLGAEFAALSGVAGDDVRDVAERLIEPLGSAVRLVLLEALAAAADEITLDMVPGSVHLRLRGSSPDFVVTVPSDPSDPTATSGEPRASASDAPAPSDSPPAGDADGGAVARINFRPPESLKARIEEAAAQDGLSVNTWLTRVATAALDQPARGASPPSRERGRAGWFG